jgi:nicotinate-nucleotide adenylyltransferase
VVEADGRTRVAFFGGTFDPPHRGHLSIARAAADAFNLQKVLFAPVGRQPLKEAKGAASFTDRLAMVRLACETDRRFEVSEIDAPRGDGVPNYTANTLEKLHCEQPGIHLFAIAGADSFLTLREWHDPDKVVELAEWIVVSRPGWPIEKLKNLGLTVLQQMRVHPLKTVHVEISATELRRKLSLGLDCTTLTVPTIADYARRHGLYQSSFESH